MTTTLPTPSEGFRIVDKPEAIYVFGTLPMSWMTALTEIAKERGFDKLDTGAGTSMDCWLFTNNEGSEKVRAAVADENEHKPLMLVHDEEDNVTEILLDLEQQTGWKVDLKMLLRRETACGVELFRYVVFRVKLHVPIDRQAYRAISKVGGYHPHPSHRDELPDRFFNVAGLPSYSDQDQLSEEWEGHPRGARIVWTCGHDDRPGVLAVCEEVGAEIVLALWMKENSP